MSTEMDAIRNFWDSNPCNLRHSTESTESIKFSREVTRKKFRVEPHIKTFAQFDKWYGRSILDAGCGIGTMSLEFARCGADVVAVDLSPISIRIAARRMLAEAASESWAILRSSRSQFYCHDIEHLSDVCGIGETQFDLIFSFGVVHHTPHPEMALKEFRKVIKDGGELRLMVYHRWSTKAIWLMLTGDWPFRSVDKCIARQSEANKNCPVAFTYSKRQIKKLLRNCGWEPTSVKADHIFPYSIEPYKAGEYRKKWYWRFLPAPVFRLMEKLFGWHILIKARPAEREN